MKILNTRILKKGVITLSFLCYLITCGFVPYYYDEATNLCYGDGLFNLFFGWCCFVFPGIFTKIYSLAWFSNITYIVAIRHLIKENGSPDKLGGKILNFPEKVIPLCHE